VIPNQAHIVVEFEAFETFNFLRRRKMKAKLAALVATPLIGFSSLTFAQGNQLAERPVPQEPVLLTAAEMDTVTAAGGAALVDVDVRTGDILSDNFQINYGSKHGPRKY
jgi:hypothetical protein